MDIRVCSVCMHIYVRSSTMLYFPKQFVYNYVYYVASSTTYTILSKLTFSLFSTYVRIYIRSSHIVYIAIAT